MQKPKQNRRCTSERSRKFVSSKKLFIVLSVEKVDYERVAKRGLCSYL